MIENSDSTQETTAFDEIIDLYHDTITSVNAIWKFSIPSIIGNLKNEFKKFA